METGLTAGKPGLGRDAAACVSFAFYWAWVFSTLVSPTLLQGFDAAAGEQVRCLGALGLSAGLALQYVFLHRVSRLNSLFYTFACSLFPLAYCAYVATAEAPSFALAGALSFLASFSASFLLSTIGAAFSHQSRLHGIVGTCLASSAGAAGSVAIALLPQDAAAVSCALLIPCSTVAFRIARMMPEPETNVDRARARLELGAYKRVLAYMLGFGLVFGLVIHALNANVQEAHTPATLASIVAPGLIVLGIAWGLGKRTDFESILRPLLCSLVVVLLAGLFVPSHAAPLVLVALVLVYGVFDLSNLVTLYELIRENGLPGVSTFSLGRLFCELGIPVGWGVGMAVSALQPAGAHFVFALMLTLSVAMALTLAVGNQPDPDLPGSRGDAAVAPYDFDVVVEQLAGKFGLSKRETEVFGMLARGRTPKRISEMLVVSESTAKSHAYRIYRKMDVHSQQDLIDAVEDALEKHRKERWRPIP